MPGFGCPLCLRITFGAHMPSLDRSYNVLLLMLQTHWQDGTEPVAIRPKKPTSGGRSSSRVRDASRAAAHVASARHRAARGGQVDQLEEDYASAFMALALMLGAFFILQEMPLLALLTALIVLMTFCRVN